MKIKLPARSFRCINPSSAEFGKIAKIAIHDDDPLFINGWKEIDVIDGNFIEIETSIENEDQQCPICNVKGWIESSPVWGNEHICRACKGHFIFPQIQTKHELPPCDHDECPRSHCIKVLSPITDAAQYWCPDCGGKDRPGGQRDTVVVDAEVCRKIEVQLSKWTNAEYFKGMTPEGMVAYIESLEGQIFNDKLAKDIEQRFYHAQDGKGGDIRKCPSFCGGCEMVKRIVTFIRQFNIKK